MLAGPPLVEGHMPFGCPVHIGKNRNTFSVICVFLLGCLHHTILLDS